jgi:hypothetical protein
MPRSEDEVVAAGVSRSFSKCPSPSHAHGPSSVRLAGRLGLKVIARGTQHCMGAQSVRFAAYSTLRCYQPRSHWSKGCCRRHHTRHALHEQRRVQPRRPISHVRFRRHLERRHLYHQCIRPQPPYLAIVRTADCIPLIASAAAVFHSPTDTVHSVLVDLWAQTPTASPPTLFWPSLFCRLTLSPAVGTLCSALARSFVHLFDLPPTSCHV